MQRLFYLAAVTILLTVVFTACSKDDDSDHQKQMTLTLQTSDDAFVQIYISGTGAATIDWGDGADSTHRFEDGGITLFHHYSGMAATAIVTITGENIRYLSCRYVQLLNLDVSKNTRLTSLSCEGNQLTSLDVSKNTRLTDLRCGDNQLTSLDVSKNTRLTSLSCEGNQLTSLDVSNNTDLSWLVCSANRLMTLNVHSNMALAVLECDLNQLTNLDVSKNKALQTLCCNDNQLTNLDLSKNSILDILKCCNNLFTCEGLNALFESLHSDGGIILVCNNYETFDCDISIATNKNWEVEDWWWW